MKLTSYQLVLCIVFAGLVSAKTIRAQDILSQPVTVHILEQQMKSALQTLEKSSNIKFVYSSKLIDAERRVSLRVTNVPLATALDKLLRPLQLKYEVSGRQIVLDKADKPTSALEIKSVAENLDKLIAGRVTDISGEALPGVNVLIKGTQQGTVTDVEGRYKLDVADDQSVLILSFVGYISQEIPVGNQTTIDVKLTPDNKALDEVVVVGYGTARKATLTGSVSTLKGEALSNIPSGNLSNSLAGKFSGLTVVTTSGQPGNDNSTLRIRGLNTLGNNTPLIVVDGIQGRDFNRLNPNDIDNITILKDASAAIYGSQAANGVILVTTKRGVSGKSEVSINVRQGMSSPTIIPKFADAATYAQTLNEIDLYAKRPARYSQEDIRLFADGTDPWLHPNTSWYDLIFRKSTPQTFVDASMRGGTENVKYYLSAAYSYQDGIFRKSANNYNQIGIRSNLDAKLNKYVNLGVDLNFRQENRNNSTVALFDLLRYGMGRPNRVAFYGDYPASGYESGKNPGVVATDVTGYDKSIDYIFQSNTKLEIAIPGVEGLSLVGNAAFDKFIENQKTWRTPWMLYSWDGLTMDSNNMPVVTGAMSGYSTANLDQSMIDRNGLVLNGLINYSRTLGRHHVKGMVGIERGSGKSMNFSAFRSYFASTLIDELFAGGDLDKTNTGSASNNARRNYFGRFNYDFSSKYLVELVFRYDGSYIFPEGKQYGFFPSISAGWIASDEAFWKDNLSFINTFKVRGSWGQTGNDRIDPYQFLASYGFDNSANGTQSQPKDSKNTTVFNGHEEVKFLKELRIANPSITWEVASQTNLGVDMSLMNHKLDISADYFYNLRSNILCYRNASIPSTAGLTLPRENIGKVSNQGIEFDIFYTNSAGDFTYSIGLNGGYAKSKVIFWDESPNVPDYQRATGKPVNTDLISNNSAGLFYEAIGIFRDEEEIKNNPHWLNARPGDIMFRDVNGDGKIDGLDRVRSDKTTTPLFTSGLNFNLGYRGLYLNAGFQAAMGATRYHEIESGELGNFSMEDLDGRWTPDNIDASKPRVGNYRSEYWNQGATGPNTYWNRNSDYLRLKNLEVGYKVPDAVSSKLGLKNCRIYYTGMNLLTFTALKTFDPETTSSTGYPLNKVNSLGLSLSF
ncbi:TonB-dependent receptor [Dyadobacter sp. CY323]|nr:TonB-dependent receptor [Dyadobacter sp. CY323]